MAAYVSLGRKIRDSRTCVLMIGTAGGQTETSQVDEYRPSGEFVRSFTGAETLGLGESRLGARGEHELVQEHAKDAHHVHRSERERDPSVHPNRRDRLCQACGQVAQESPA